MVGRYVAHETIGEDGMDLLIKGFCRLAVTIGMDKPVVWFCNRLTRRQDAKTVTILKALKRLIHQHGLSSCCLPILFDAEETCEFCGKPSLVLVQVSYPESDARPCVECFRGELRDSWQQQGTGL